MAKPLPSTVRRQFVRLLKRESIDYQRGAADMLRALVDEQTEPDEDTPEKGESDGKRSAEIKSAASVPEGTPGEIGEVEPEERRVLNT